MSTIIEKFVETIHSSLPKEIKDREVRFMTCAAQDMISKLGDFRNATADTDEKFVLTQKLVDWSEFLIFSRGYASFFFDPKSLVDAEEVLILQGQTIGAIKLVRERLGVGLTEAKALVDCRRGDLYAQGKIPEPSTGLDIHGNKMTQDPSTKRWYPKKPEVETVGDSDLTNQDADYDPRGRMKNTPRYANWSSKRT